MTHKIKKVSGWVLFAYKDGSMKFTQGNKFILVHKSMCRYWVDYGLLDGHMMGTLNPVKTLRGAMRKVEEVKDEFGLTEKR